MLTLESVGWKLAFYIYRRQAKTTAMQTREEDPFIATRDTIIIMQRFGFLTTLLE